MTTSWLKSNRTDTSRTSTSPRTTSTNFIETTNNSDEVRRFVIRRVSDGLDVSGFVKSKKAGERLLRMVRLVLEKDETDSWLDYREREPNWIQFKFKPTEFDLNKLDELTKNNDNIITLDILKQCKLQ